MDKITFGIIGGGWRCEFYLRIAKELPDFFEIRGIVTRSEEKGSRIEKQWGVKTFRTVEDLLKTHPSFVVVSVPWEAAPVLTKELTDKGIAVLSETPPAPDLEGLIKLNKIIKKDAKVQVAEQYHLQPFNAALIDIAKSGRLGRVSQVQLSVCHGYHAMSLMRKLLDIGFENAAIRAQKIISPIVNGPDREIMPKKEEIKESYQVIATLDFYEKLCVYDFTGDQYFSYIRSNRILVRGEKGEINGSKVKYLKNYLTPVEIDLKRLNAGENGNLEGLYLKGILLGNEWIYKNPFIGGRLSDDEIAIASCLQKMDAYVKGGASFYSLAEASQDHYLGMMIDKAAAANECITTEKQSWAD